MLTAADVNVMFGICFHLRINLFLVNYIMHKFNLAILSSFTVCHSILIHAMHIHTYNIHVVYVCVFATPPPHIVLYVRQCCNGVFIIILFDGVNFQNLSRSCC